MGRIRWLVSPNWGTFWKLLGVLAIYLVAMSTGATLIAHATGYDGGSDRLFALSMTAAYTPASAQLVLRDLGASGRVADAITLATFDVLFPLVYATLLSIGLRLVARGLGLPAPAQRLAAAAPFTAAIANWLADLCIVALLLAYSGTGVALAASGFTTAKLLVLVASAAAVLLGGALVLALHGIARLAGAFQA